MYGAGDVWGGAIRRDMTEMIYETRTSASRQTENPGRKFFFADVVVVGNNGDRAYGWWLWVIDEIIQGVAVASYKMAHEQHRVRHACFDASWQSMR